MKEIKLKGTDIVTTSLGYGCGGLMRIPTSYGRARVINEAYDEGIRYFDMARMYGLGKVEAEVGKALKNKRDKVVLATKFGIETRDNTRIISSVQSIARQVLNLMPPVKRFIKRKEKLIYAPRKYDVDTARDSLEKSLSALKTDYIDILLLHEPSLADLRELEVFEYLDEAKEKGMIRAWGLAGYPDQLEPILRSVDICPDIIQIPNDILGQQIFQFDGLTKASLITFSPFSSAYTIIHKYLGKNRGIAAVWSEKLGLDILSEENLSMLMLGYCFNTNANGVVLFSSSKRKRIEFAKNVCNQMVNDETTDILMRLISTNKENIIKNL